MHLRQTFLGVPLCPLWIFYLRSSAVDFSYVDACSVMVLRGDCAGEWKAEPERRVAERNEVKRSNER